VRPPETLPTAILAGLGLHPDRVSRLSSGLASQAWRVDSDGAATVLRISAWPPDEPTTYRSEHALLGRLTQLGAAVPAPITGHWRHPELPAPPFSLTAFLEGAPLRTSPDHAAIEAMAAFLRELHGIEARRYGPLRQVDHVEATAADPGAGLRERWLGLHAWLIEDVDLADHPAWGDHRELLEAAAAHGPAAFDDAMSAPMALIHSDLHEENILESETGLAFIDFGETFRGTAAWEFASLAYFLGWPLADAVLAAYVGDAARLGRWHGPVSRLGLSFGLSRWEQDRSAGVDEEVHDEAFLRASLARL
jgi:aminoglycoside phosphotransferase (APT) family kinase protein